MRKDEMDRISLAIRPEHRRKLESLAAQSRRSQSAVIRILIERATVGDLAVVQVEELDETEIAEPQA